MRMDDLINTAVDPMTGKKLVDVAADRLRQQLLEVLRDPMRKEYGIELVDIRLSRFNHPVNVRASIFERIQSERSKKVAEYQSDGDLQSKNILSKADQEVREKLAQARAEEEAIKAAADTEAIQIRNQAYSQDKEFYEFLQDDGESAKRRRRREHAVAPVHASADVRVAVQSAAHEDGGQEVSNCCGTVVALSPDHPVVGITEGLLTVLTTLLWHGFLTVPLRRDRRSPEAPETFGQETWHGRETVPQPREGQGIMLRFILYLAGLAFLVWTVSTSLTQVGPGERAVVRRFGRVLDIRPEPGLYIGWPWGIERVERENVSLVRRVTIGFTADEEKEDEVVPAGQVLTGDHNLVNVQAAIHYRIREADVASFVLQKDNVEAFIARAGEALMAEWIASRRVDDVLRRGKVDLPAVLQDRLQERLNEYDLGVEIEQASITRLAPPRQVKEAFESLTKAETEIRTRVNQAEEAAGRMRNDTRSKIFALERQAAAYANEERVKAKAEASTFQKRLEQYHDLSRKGPGLPQRPLARRDDSRFIAAWPTPSASRCSMIF